MKISPSLGWSSPPIRFKRVLLPEPLGPMMERNSPFSIRKETSRNACTSCSPW